MIDIQNITIAHRGSQPLLVNQSCTLTEGTLTALTGRNGSGKSTLLRAVCGTQSLLSGRILLGQERINVGEAAPARLASLISLVTTGRVEVRHMTVRQLVEMGRAPRTGLFGMLHAIDHEAVNRAIDLVGLSELADREISRLSDGEHQRLMLARALAQDTPIILLDEPTGFLDVPNRRAVTALLASLAHNESKCILYSTHEIDPALANADYILHLSPPSFSLLPPAEMRLYPSFATLLA